MKKKLLSLGMVLVLLLQLLPTSAFAAETPKTPYYVALGDSVTYGYGLDNKCILDMIPQLAAYLAVANLDQEENPAAYAAAYMAAYAKAQEYAEPNGMARALYNIHGANGGSGDKWEQYREQAYPQLVADALKQAVTGDPNAKAKGNEYANLGLLGATIEDFSDYLNGRGGGGMSSGLFDLETDEIRALVKDEVSKADFITLAVGSNDLNGAISRSGSSDEDDEDGIYYPGDKTPIAQQMVSIVMTVVMLGMLEIPMDIIMQLVGGMLNSEASEDEDEASAPDASVVLADEEETGDEEKTGGLLSGINMAELEAILKFVDTENLTKLMSAGVGGAKDKYMGDIEAIMATNPDVQLAVLGIVNPYGNSVEYHGTRYTKAQIIATLITEVVRMAIEAAMNNTGTEEQPLSEVPVMDVQEIVEFARENPEVLAEQEEAPASEFDFTETLEKSQDALERVENGEAFVFDAEEFIEDYSGEEPEEVPGPMKSESSELDLGGLIGGLGIDTSGEDALVNALLYGLVYNMFGVPLQQAMAEMDRQAEDAVNDWNKAHNSNNVSFIYAMDRVSKVDPEEGVLPKHLFSVHPRAYGHQEIAGVINEKFVSNVTYDSNLGDGYTVNYNGGADNQTKALWGSKLVLTIPETVGTGSTVDFVVVNNKRVWDKNTSLTRTVEVEITEPDIGTFVYAHCSGSDVAAVLTKRNADALTVLGDSIAAGFNLKENLDISFTPNKSYRNSYPTYAAKELKKQLYNLGKPACNTAEMLAILGSDDARSIYNAPSADDRYGWRLVKDIYADALADSDAVVLHLGANDYMEELVGYIMSSIGLQNSDKVDIPKLLLGITNLAQGKFLRLTPAQIAAVMKQLTGGPKLTDIELSALDLALNKTVFRQEMKLLSRNNQYNEIRLMAELDKRLGADVDKVCLSLYNPVTDNGEMAEMNQAISEAMGASNDNLNALCAAYGWTYIDITGVETGMSNGDPHPTKAGHQFIADKIVEALGNPAPVQSTPAESTPAEPTSGGSTGGGSTGGGSVGGGSSATAVSTGTSVTAEPADKVCEGFTDVALDQWSHEGIHYCLENSLMNGVGDNAFNPAGTTTRGMIVTMLARLSGADTTATGSQWYLPGQEWAVANGISDGTMMTSNITREQLAKMLYSYAQSQGKGFTGSWMFLLDFNDAASISDWADEAMHWCVMKGILNGKGDKMLDPQGEATRAEVAAMFMRFCENVSAK